MSGRLVRVWDVEWCRQDVLYVGSAWDGGGRAEPSRAKEWLVDGCVGCEGLAGRCVGRGRGAGRFVVCGPVGVGGAGPVGVGGGMW